MISIGIIGGSGYTGKKLVQLCSSHPNISEIKIYGFSSVGKNITELFPDLVGVVAESQVSPLSNLSLDHDLYFIALPHGEALSYIPILIKYEKNIIDLGGDYRLNSADLYQEWYNKIHTSPDLLNKKIYGLADYPGIDYSNSNLIANPGCYPTAGLLSLLPLVNNFNEEILNISVSAYSGTSGAGKTPKTELMMSEMDGNVAAYNLNKHRHQPEILQMLNRFGFNSTFSFATHLLPAAVGIYSTSFVHLKKDIDKESILNCYEETYKNSFFIRLRNAPPQLSWVVNTNFCDINISIKDRTVIITAAIDNLIKGAAGQAIQNMNKLYGWEETLGIINQGVKNVSVY